MKIPVTSQPSTALVPAMLAPDSLRMSRTCSLGLHMLHGATCTSLHVKQWMALPGVGCDPELESFLANSTGPAACS